jgi:beta-galactosidase GanA
MTEVNRIFKVKGKPFYPLGRHRIYMAGYVARDEAEIEANLKASKECDGNTVCHAIFWDEIEPEEGKFDFSSVDTVIRLARKYDLKLIFLWFAVWKNAVMDYAPEWMKADPQRFKRVICPTGKTIWVLSSHCKATLEADKKAFAALCKHLKTFDGKEQTVIGLQIENEPGIIGSERDYSPAGQAEFDSQVPAKLMSAMKAKGKGEVYDLWQQAGGKKSGSWTEVFGVDAGECMTAWSIAVFINEVSKVGKAAYDIATFINVWGMEQSWWPVPGEAYPSGGPVHKVLDIYKWFTPDVDTISLDNYNGDAKGKEWGNVNYARDDNPLFIVESQTNLNMFRNIADYDAIGYFTHYEQAEDGSLFPAERRRIDNVRSVAAMIPLLLKYQGTGKIQAVIEEEFQKRNRVQRMDFDGYMGMAEFRGTERAGGLIIQVSKHEFYFAGVDFRIMLRPKPVLGETPITLLAASDLSHPNFINFFVRVCEGHFNEKGEYVVDRRRNGDDVRGGIWVGPPDSVMQLITSD